MTGHMEYVAAEARYLASEGLSVRERFFDTPRLGSRLRVLEAGDGPPVLFLSGAMTSGMVFASLAARLPDFRCLLLDRPGTGLSEMLLRPPTDLAAHEAFADLLVADVLDGLGIDRAHLVTTSLGGWYGFRGAAAAPDRLDRIAGLALQVGAPIVSAPWFMRQRTPPAFLVPRHPRMPRSLIRRMLRAAGLRPTFDAGKFSEEALDAVTALYRHTETVRNEMLFNPVGASGGFDAVRHPSDLLARIQAPVHLFWGTDDLFGGADSAHAFAAGLPDATVEMVEGAGHAPWLDEPDRAAEATRRHLGA